jgi:hypothetical protein
MTEVLIMIVIVMVLAYMFILYRTVHIQNIIIKRQKELIEKLENSNDTTYELIKEQRKYITILEEYNKLIPKEQIKELYNIDDILDEISLKGIDKVNKDKLDYLKNHGKNNKG